MMQRTNRSGWFRLGSAHLGTALLAAALAIPCAAQTTGPAATDLKPNPLVALREFEGPANDEYELGAGDEISIDFGGRPELNSKKIIGPDGRITISPAGSMLIADKTREQAAQVIAASMSAYYSWLSVTVGVDKYTSNRVLLLGAVEHPGIVSFNSPPTLLEVLTIGGAVSKSNQGNTIPNSTGVVQTSRLSAAVPERCAIYRGSDKVMWVDVKALIDSGSALADLRLKRGDVVYVPSAAERYVSVIGQVQHPGALQLDNNTTLAKLIAESGGLTLLAGNNPDIRVIQQATGKVRVIPFKSLLQPGKMDLSLNSGDVVFVPESGFNSFSYVLEKLSPLVSIFTTASILKTN